MEGDMADLYWCKDAIDRYGILFYYFHRYGKCYEYECQEDWKTCIHRVKRKSLILKENSSRSDSERDEEKWSEFGLDTGW